MSDSPSFEIDRAERMHSYGPVVRPTKSWANMVLGDTNREKPASVPSTSHERPPTEGATDESIRCAGHACDEGCCG